MTMPPILIFYKTTTNTAILSIVCLVKLTMFFHTSYYIYTQINIFITYTFF